MCKDKGVAPVSRYPTNMQRNGFRGHSTKCKYLENFALYSTVYNHARGLYGLLYMCMLEKNIIHPQTVIIYCLLVRVNQFVWPAHHVQRGHLEPVHSTPLTAVHVVAKR